MTTDSDDRTGTALFRARSLWRSGREPIPTQPFVAGIVYDDVVVGAGITGLSTALMLAEAGRSVVVLEAEDVGALATGNTTGKISLLQGSRLSTIRRHHSKRVLEAYVDSNRDGQEWLLEFCERAGVQVERRTAYSYAQQAGGDSASAVEAEHRAAREAGLPATIVEGGQEVDVPFPFAYGVALPGQAQFDAMEALGALAAAFVAAGGRIHDGTRVVGVTASEPCRVRTTRGEVQGRTVVLATATPILDRGLYFSKTHGLRSYGASFEVPDAGTEGLSEGMFLSIGDDDPDRSRSIRTAPARLIGRDSGDLLVLGGNGHPVGRPGDFSEQQRLDDLAEFARSIHPDARLTHSWSAQDYESHNLIPFVGLLPRGRGRVYLATGYAKWGLTNGVAAALRLRDEILGVPRVERRHWHRVLGTRITKPADLGRGAKDGAIVGVSMTRGWLGASTRPVPVPRPAEGEGVVAASRGVPVGISTVDGVTCAVRAVCPHLGGVLEWNDAERSWDCPLHASRFAADGARIEGPAVKDLPVLPRTRTR
ncbi:FAD-dependent oxidoreductase [Herbiconiux sp.]|uniref:FAD-dependent oxidoreductase n=1 Tax=Herbiconiux sp. TaxID=1871186 RepID=UPI0025BF3F8F|nr:FAD-dependent oxidoreductase [Herbiconiux sp.]